MPFSLLKNLFSSGPKEPDYDHIVWNSNAEKFKALVERIQQQTASGGQVLLLVWFPKTMQELDFLLTNMNIPFAKGLSDTSNQNLIIEMADNFLGLISHPSQLKANCQIWLSEHYPLHAPEVALFEKIASQLPNVKPVIFTSLDEQLFTAFGGSRIKEIMEKLGYAKGEYMEHNMIKQSVVNAQKKVAEQVTNEQKANSCESWFTANYRTRL
jgi:preprotein translocase subunit SecA